MRSKTMKCDWTGRTLCMTEITIKNFRSIRSMILPLDRFNVISGLNDVGKSNVLKALNLFFNGETDYGKPYNFEEDYCLNAPVQKKKAKTIEITIKFRIPENFKDSGEVSWTKRWGRQGLVVDNGKGTDFSSRSKARTLFSRIKYRYVPAIKSELYFKSLLKDLYSSIAREVDSGLAKKTREYSETIKQYTERISDQVHDQFGIQSALEYPKDQSAIFKELQFVTDIQHGHRVSLTHRGDGVQAIHIPAILRFIAEKDNEGLASNSILYSTFWGYEEPENGLEMMRCYDMAEKLYASSQQIQMLVTSHSPAFFSIGKGKGRFSWMEKDLETGFTRVSETSGGIKELGYMPLIAPFLDEKIREIDKLRKLMDESPSIPVNTIMVEGPSDKLYLERAFSIFSPTLTELISSKQMRIFCRNKDGGTVNLVDYVKSWHYGKTKSKLLVVLDSDRAGESARQELNGLNYTSLKILMLPPSPPIKRVYEKIVQKEEFAAPIETYFSAKVWQRLDQKKLLEDRSDRELQLCFGKIAGREKAINDAIKEVISEGDRIFVDKKPHKDKKMEIAKVICALADKEADVFENYAGLVSTIEGFFKLGTQNA